MAEETRSRLGRGLASLIGDVGGECRACRPAARAAQGADRVLRPNPRNPRRNFSDAELERARRIDQAARRDPADRGAAGARRAGGASRSSPASGAGARRRPPACTRCRSCRSRSATSDALEIAIIENVQREDLNAMEEAQGYHALANEFKRSQEDIAKIVGKSRSHVANMMRLTKLPAESAGLYRAGQLSAGHARALIGVPDPLAAAKRIVEEGLNVRQAEALAHVEGVPERKPQKARGSKAKDPNTVSWKKRVSDALGLAVNINHRDTGGIVHIVIASSISSTRSCAG